MIKKFLIIIVAVLVIVFGVVAWNSQDNQDNSKTIFVSMYPAFDVVKNVVGDNYNVELITQPGVDPHDFEPTGKQIAAIEESALFVWFENIGDWEEDVAKNLGDGKSINLTDESVVVLEGGEDDHHDEEHSDDEEEKGGDKDEDKKHSDEDGHDHGHVHGGNDPHVWLNPSNMKAFAQKILQEVSLLDSNNSSLYETNTNSYIQKLNQIDSDLESSLASCNQDNIVTSHDAFGYLGDRYIFEILTIRGFDPSVEPSASELAQISSKINELGLNTVLFETQISSDFANVVAQETGSNLDVIYSMESPTDEEVSEFEDYVGFMKQNQKVLTSALDCN